MMPVVDEPFQGEVVSMPEGQIKMNIEHRIMLSLRFTI
jgi:hypothetical protein